jgi:hypothetical protein
MSTLPIMLHALLAFLLLFQQFAFARDVAAVALGEVTFLRSGGLTSRGR